MLKIIFWIFLFALAIAAGFQRTVREERDGTAEKRRQRQALRRRWRKIENEGFRIYPAAGHYFKRREYIHQRALEEGLL